MVLRRSFESRALVSLFLFAVAATSTDAQTVANGPYYATPSWDQTLPVNTRFIVLANMNQQAVLDRETGLVWERVPSTSALSWFLASIHCVQLNLGGRKGWRLPTIQDLASLIDPTVGFPGPTLPSGHPFTVQSSGYWSATTFANNAALAWFAQFGDGTVNGVGKSGDNSLAWCVRGGQGAEVQ